MAVDATGIDSWRRSRHYENRIGKKTPYAKLDILVDTETMLIHDHVLHTQPRHETIGATKIFRRTKLRGVTILADRGYDSEPLHEIAEERQLILFAPVRDFKVRRPKGFHRRRCAKGNDLYGKRNLIECTMHALKAKQSALFSKLPYMKKREMAWIVLIFNLERISRMIKFILELCFCTILERAGGNKVLNTIKFKNCKWT